MKKTKENNDYHYIRYTYYCTCSTLLFTGHNPLTFWGNRSE